MKGRRAFSKSDTAWLGKRYAERLIYTPQFRFEDMQELTGRIEWQESGEAVRQKITRDAKSAARQLLLQAGYDLHKVQDIVG